MSQPQGEITHVSDTALVVAACRALETEAEDGFVNDPFAARLGGERGMAMLRSIPQPEMMRFGVGVRSHFIDELPIQVLAPGSITTVVSLGVRPRYTALASGTSPGSAVDRSGFRGDAGLQRGADDGGKRPDAGGSGCRPT